jgi:hypothetical protein
MTFRIEWEPAPGVSHPVLARTWARIEIAIGDTCVTTVLDRQGGGTRTGIYGPTFVLAEWIVRNFWFLLWESTSGVAPTPAWLRRHSLATAREGTSLPRLQCYRDEEKIVAAWARDPHERDSRPVTFIESGTAELDVAVVQARLSDFVDLVLDQVRNLDHPDVVGLREDWKAITSATGNDALLCRRAARMGLDAYDPSEVSDELATLLTEGVGRLPVATGDDLLDAAVAPEKLASSIATVCEAVRADASRAPQVVKGTPKLELEHRRNGLRPYEQGYALADALRNQLKQQPDGPFDLKRALASLRWSDVHQPQESWTQLDYNVKGAVGMSPNGTPCLLARPGRATADRFLVARGLYALLSGATATAPRLLTSAGTRLQSASRAFAAELLAPAAALRARVPGRLDDERVDDLAQEFDVSPMVIHYQLENQAGLA